MPNMAGLDRFSCVGLNNNNCGIIYIQINRSILPTEMCYIRSGCSSATCAISDWNVMFQLRLESALRKPNGECLKDLGFGH